MLAPLKRITVTAENTVAVACLALVTLLPIIEVALRRMSYGLTASTDYIYHLVLWITFTGGMITSREGRHLSLAAVSEFLSERFRTHLQVFRSCVSVAVCSGLAWSALQFIRIGVDSARTIGLFPRQAVLMIMPIGFMVMTIRFITHAPTGIRSRTLAASGLCIGPLFGYACASMPGFLWPAMLILAAAAVSGAPIFIILGGVASLLFLHTGGTTVVIPNEAYTMLTGPTIPAIPLFTLAGFILSESKSGERLVRLFRALFGWLPGGLAIMTILICTFFTALTGASSVTILALGGLLSYILIQNGYSKRFSTGLLTVNGIGSLFPPSLPIIMFGVVARTNIQHMFMAVLLPCGVMVLGLIILSVTTACRRRIPCIPFNGREALGALAESFWEICIPFIILIFYFGGITTLVETGAITVVYVTIVEMLIKRDMNPQRLAAAALKAIPLIGGVLVILAAAKGLSYFVVDAEVPMALMEWMRRYVTSKYVFLALLNVSLLMVGCFMDIFSAIIVVVPLLMPLADAYGVSPLHLGVIFLANMEIGLLTPPVGINLFLASYRFNTPIMRIFRDVFPFFLTMAATLILITYVPAFSTMLVDIFFK